MESQKRQFQRYGVWADWVSICHSAFRLPDFPYETDTFGFIVSGNALPNPTTGVRSRAARGVR